ncbi:hypothetical protein [Enterococcus sp. DIV0724b]|uniref:hypothetical protein n=1 Tax=Enterococcus sp. DIV0724b TaxID=2774694 RepID=UPI003D2FA801
MTRTRQKRLAPSNKKKFTKIIFQIYVNFSLFLGAAFFYPVIQLCCFWIFESTSQLCLLFSL